MKDYTKLDTEEFNELIFKEFPELFKEKLEYGCECSKGWQNLIYTFLHHLQWYVKNYPEMKLENLGIVQIKEKYSLIRIYINNGNDAVYQMVHLTEELSGFICEKCGQKGHNRVYDNWYITLCEPCYKQWIKKREESFSKWYLMKYKIRRWFK